MSPYRFPYFSSSLQQVLTYCSNPMAKHRDLSHCEHNDVNILYMYMMNHNSLSSKQLHMQIDTCMYNYYDIMQCGYMHFKVGQWHSKHRLELEH